MLACLDVNVRERVSGRLRKGSQLLDCICVDLSGLLLFPRVEARRRDDLRCGRAVIKGCHYIAGLHIDFGTRKVRIWEPLGGGQGVIRRDRLGGFSPRLAQLLVFMRRN